MSHPESARQHHSSGPILHSLTKEKSLCPAGVDCRLGHPPRAGASLWSPRTTRRCELQSRLGHPLDTVCRAGGQREHQRRDRDPDPHGSWSGFSECPVQKALPALAIPATMGGLRNFKESSPKCGAFQGTGPFLGLRVMLPGLPLRGGCDEKGA